MSEVVIPVLERRRIEYTHLAAGAQQSITLCPAIDVINFYYIRLLLRVHARSYSGGQLIALSLYNTLPSEDDPRQFTLTSSLVTSVSCSASIPTSVPGLVVGTTASNPGPFLNLRLFAFQDPAAAGTFYAELSAELLGRPS